MSAISDPIKMVELFLGRCASDRVTTRISVLTSAYTKKCIGREHMGTYVDEFESLFSQLERMGHGV